jgi:two-component system, chemotaxis family, sensor kinase Cph1
MSHSRPVALRWITTPLFRWSLAILGAVAVGLVLFEALHISVFQKIGLPHEYCYLQDTKLVGLHVTSDLLIALSYITISATLGYLLLRASKGIPFHGVFVAFGLFIVSCGITHLMEVWVIWEPVYWLSGYTKVVTAAASVATAIALVPLVPRVLLLIRSAREGEQRRVQVEQLNQDLERFNYSVAHDLRAPLRGISGFAQLLEQESDGVLSARGKQHLARIQNSAARMDSLINDLLQYAKIGSRELVLGPVDPSVPLRSAMELMDAQIRQLEAEIVIPPLPTVVADSALLQVVFQNLLANSLKFVAPSVRPRIEASATIHERHAVLSLVDNGIGVPEAAHAKIFRMFERFNSNYPGTGIGLAIAHRAMERMHGRIGSTPRPANSGAEFWIELPLG